MESPGADAHFEMALPEIDRSVGIPNRVMPRNGKSGRVGFYTKTAASKIGHSKTHLGADEPSRPLRCIRDLVAAGIH